MQAWGSIASALLTALAVLITGLLLRHELRVRRQELADNDAAQARLVSAEIIKPFGDPEAGWLGVECRVVNHSSQPVFYVLPGIRPTTGGPMVAQAQLNTMGSQELPPGCDVYQRLTFDDPREWDTADTSRGLVAEVFFTDSKGIYWIRKELKAPRRITADKKWPTLGYLIAEFLRLPRSVRQPPILWHGLVSRLEAGLSRRLAKRSAARRK
jgi:hypothetical protein